MQPNYDIFAFLRLEMLFQFLKWVYFEEMYDFLN